jgi:hypothetical protein
MNNTIINNIEYSESDYGWCWYNIISNLLCIFPAILFGFDKNYYDALIILGTGLTSFLYHLNNNEPQVLNHLIFDKTGILMADTIMSDIIIFQTATYLSFYKDYEMRSILLFILLPFEIYLNVSTHTLHMYIIFFLVGVLSLFMLFNLYKKRRCKIKYILILFGGLSFTITGLVMYKVLQEMNDKDYNMYHSFHHTCAFISLLFYYFIPKSFKFKFPLLRNITSNCDIKTMSDDSARISIDYDNNNHNNDIDIDDLEMGDNDMIRKRDNSPSILFDRFDKPNKIRIE